MSDTFRVPESHDEDRIRRLFGLSPTALRRAEDKEELEGYWSGAVTDFSIFRGKLCCTTSELKETFRVKDSGADGEFVPRELPLTMGLLLRDGKVLSADELRSWFKEFSSQPPLRSNALTGVLQWATSFLTRPSSAQPRALEETCELLSAKLLGSLTALIVEKARTVKPDESIFFLQPSGRPSVDSLYTFRSFIGRVVCADEVVMTQRGAPVTPKHGSNAQPPNAGLKRLLLGLSDNDVFLLAAHMLRDGKAAMQATGSGAGGVVLKILRESDSTGHISPLESSLLQLRANLADAESEIERLSREPAEYTVKAKACMERQDEAGGLRWLRRREGIKRRLKALEQSAQLIDNTLSTLEQATDQAKLNQTLFKVYSDATRGLRDLRDESGVTPASAEAAREAFELEFEKTRSFNEEVGATLQRSVGGDEDDEDELLAELQESMKNLSVGVAKVPGVVEPVSSTTEAAATATGPTLSLPEAPTGPIELKRRVNESTGKSSELAADTT